MLTNETLKAFNAYVKNAQFEWESGVTTTTEATARFCEQVKNFTVHLVIRDSKAYLIIINSEDSTELLITSPIQEITICTNGYARVQTCNTTYQLWRK